MIVLNLVLNPLATWTWLGVLIALTVVALIWRRKRALRVLAIAALVVTALFREQSIPTHADMAMQRQQAASARSEGFRAGARNMLGYVRDTQRYAVVTVCLLTALALFGRVRAKE